MSKKLPASFREQDAPHGVDIPAGYVYIGKGKKEYAQFFSDKTLLGGHSADPSTEWFFGYVHFDQENDHYLINLKDYRSLLDSEEAEIKSGENVFQDFLLNPHGYNAAYLVKAIRALANLESDLTGGPIQMTIKGVDESKSLQEVLKYVSENPQPISDLTLAVDVMVSGWVRAKFMDLIDAQKEALTSASS